MKIEGKNPVWELLNSNNPVQKLLVEQGAENSLGGIINLAQKKRIFVKYLPKNVMDRESEAKNHQGVIAFVEGFKYAEVENMLKIANQKNEPPFLILCDEIADPHNLGSLIRTAECAGAHGLIIPKNRSCQVNSTVIKVSTGSAFNLKIACVNNLNNCIRDLKKQGVFVFALEAGGESIYKTDLTGSIALVVGSDGFGVSALTKKLCDGILSLPMKGKINSLNASVAGAIGIYEAVKQRLEK